MKKIFSILTFAMIFLVACGPSKKDVLLVNDQLVNKVGQVSNTEKHFFEACRTYEPTKIQAELKELTETCKRVKSELEAMEVHKDLEKLKNAAVELVNFYVKTEAEYKEYARLYSIQSADFTEEDEKLTKEVATKINDNINAGFTSFQLTQEEFANKYQYTLSKSSYK